MSAIDITKDSFKTNVAEAGGAALVEFWAPWCGYCRRIGPAFEKVAQQRQDSLLMGRVNIDDEPELAERERVEVIPTFIFYKAGKAMGRITAPESKAQLDEFIDRQLEA